MKRRIHTHWDLNISFRETSCSPIRLERRTEASGSRDRPNLRMQQLFPGNLVPTFGYSFSTVLRELNPLCAHYHWDLAVICRDNDLSTIISNLHQSRQLVMPETQSRCEFKRNSIDVGLGAAGSPRLQELPGSQEGLASRARWLQAMLVMLPTSTSERSDAMALVEKRTSIPQGSGGESSTSFIVCLWQQRSSFTPLDNSHTPVLEDAVTQMTPEEHYRRMMSALNEHSTFEEQQQQRLYQLANSMAVPSHGGYGFLQPAQAEMFARQQEMLRKQNLARLEMSAEIIRQKELENLHRQRLLAGDPLSLHPGLPQDHPALRNMHDIPEGHPLRDELSRRNAMLVLRHNNTPLLSLNHGVPSTTPPKEQGRRGSRKSVHHRAEPPGLHETKELAEPRARDGVPDCNDEEMKDSESDAEVSDEKPESLKAESSSSASELKECKETGKVYEGAKELSEVASGQNAPCSSSSTESPSHLLGQGINKNEVKYLPPASIPPPQPLPFGFPYTMSPYFHAGAMGGLFLDGEESPALEDISKWTVEDVCNFVGSLSGCAEYTQVFREQAIDGETLPLLTEEHLLNNMGLKLGPALKIRSQVAKRVGRVLYMASFPMAFPLQPPGLRPPDRDLAPAELRPSSTGSVASPYSSSLLPASRISPKQENGNPPLMAGINDTTKPPS
ncbi:Sterile alpha motif domain-containing protein 11 [Chelonia mydas]|uniref:Sterile alpha motif domain-containing protein 11 n=1 Tax=Chelonia mydas TaxID=8469 RepID=M7ALE1_CHEMY|nr:Sterile alpha motif domain-containing protein 11 [Chelonia mydas]